MPEAPAPWPQPAGALVFAVVGAESTGKSTLAEALARQVADTTGLRCERVSEVLRTWCEANGRTPRAEEQPAIAAEQARRIAAAATRAEVVVCDTTPLMTAVYSRLIFGDSSLDVRAAVWQRACSHTLLTALDLPWQADGLQRDGPHVQAPVDAALRELLIGHDLGFSVVAGTGPRRAEAALDAISPWLRARDPARIGLLTRLAARQAGPMEGSGGRLWCCELCDSPEHERLQAARARLQRAAAHSPGCPQAGSPPPGLLQPR